MSNEESYYRVKRAAFINIDFDAMDRPATQVLPDRGVNMEPRYDVDQLSDNLKRIVSGANLPDKTKICFLSISGVYRSGKSFLMNLLGRYLRSLRAGDSIPLSWWTEQDLRFEKNYFEWHGGCEVHTAGIFIYREPFYVPKDLAVFLIDCEGLFHSRCTSCELLRAIISISSLHIANIPNEIDDFYLSLLAKEIKANNRWEVAGRTKLVFLVRNWSRPVAFPFGWDGGRDYIVDSLAPSPGLSVRQLEDRKAVEDFGEGLSCFLMPRPGDSVAEANDQERICDMEISQRFKDQLSSFASGLFQPQFLVPLSWSKLRPVTVDNIDVYMKFRLGLPSRLLTLLILLMYLNKAVYCGFSWTLMDYIHPSFSNPRDSESTQSLPLQSSHLFVIFALACCAHEVLRRLLYCYLPIWSVGVGRCRSVGAGRATKLQIIRNFVIDRQLFYLLYGVCGSVFDQAFGGYKKFLLLAIPIVVYEGMTNPTFSKLSRFNKIRDKVTRQCLNSTKSANMPV